MDATYISKAEPASLPGEAVRPVHVHVAFAGPAKPSAHFEHAMRIVQVQVMTVTRHARGAVIPSSI